MTAAELTDEWIGRTVAVHLPGVPTIVGPLISIHRGDTSDWITLQMKLGDTPSYVAAPPDTVIADQEVPWI